MGSTLKPSLPENGASLEQGNGRASEGQGVVIEGKTVLCKTKEKGSERFLRAAQLFAFSAAGHLSLSTITQ